MPAATSPSAIPFTSRGCNLQKAAICSNVSEVFSISQTAVALGINGALLIAFLSPLRPARTPPRTLRTAAKAHTTLSGKSDGYISAGPAKGNVWEELDSEHRHRAPHRKPNRGRNIQAGRKRAKLRACFRILGLVLLAAAFAEFAMDLSHSVISGEIRATPRRGMICGLAPGPCPGSKPFFTGMSGPF